MLHIGLTVLKIIGVMIASILGLVLLLLCLLLFVPIRYRASGNKTKEVLEADGRVSWLWGIVRVDFIFKNQDFKYQVRVLGIFGEYIVLAFKKVKHLFAHKKYKKKNLKEHSGVSRNELDRTIQNESSKEQKSENTASKEETEIVQSLDTEDKNLVTEKIVNCIKGFIQACRSVLTSVIHFPGKIAKRIKDIQLTICSICDKIKYWINILKEEQTKEAIGLIKEQGFLLLKHIMPRKLQGNVVFGFDDPSKTGQLLAGICVFYPLYYKQINIFPDFTQTIFLGDISLRGRLYLFIVVKVVIRVYFDKNIQYIKKKISKKSNA